jgi:hypothetical protein
VKLTNTIFVSSHELICHFIYRKVLSRCAVPLASKLNAELHLLRIVLETDTEKDRQAGDSVRPAAT